MPSSVAVEQLIERARGGSGSSLGNLLQLFYPVMLEMAEKRIRDNLRQRMSLSDLVQDTMVSASQHFPAFRGESEAEFRNWLMRVFQTRMIDGIRRHRHAERRRQQREIAVSGSQHADTSPSASHMVALEDEANAMIAALQQLPEVLQAVVRMRYFEDLKFEAIAERQGTSVPTVWRRWSEAIALLKQALHE